MSEKKDENNYLKISNSKHSSNKYDSNKKINSDPESEFKVKRTVFKDYKEWAKLPDMKLDIDQRNKMKRGSKFIETVGNEHLFEEAVIENPKPKLAPKKIIKRIAESLDAWHINNKLK